MSSNNFTLKNNVYTKKLVGNFHFFLNMFITNISQLIAQLKLEKIHTYLMDFERFFPLFDFYQKSMIHGSRSPIFSTAPRKLEILTFFFSKMTKTQLLCFNVDLRRLEIYIFFILLLTSFRLKTMIKFFFNKQFKSYYL